MWKYSKEIMSIILIIILLGLLVWAIRRIRKDGFVGSSSSESGGSGQTAVISNKPPFFSDIDAICNNRLEKDEDWNTLKGNIDKLNTTGCDAYSDYKQSVYIKNMCAMASMFKNAITSLLLTALAPGVGTRADQDAVLTIKTAFCDNRLSFTDYNGDTYADIITKFNNLDKFIIKTLTVIPTEYKYIVPDMPPYSTITGVKSYKCNTYNGIETGILSYLRARTYGTPSTIQEIADTVAVNLCKSKGWESGTGNYKGCSGCAGCCEPTQDALSPAAPITGVNTVTGAGNVNTNVADAATTAKCPQPKLREYRLNRKPAVFRKTKAPTNAFLECFEDADVSRGERPINLRESQRMQKGEKLYDFTRRVGL
jgi:hypothetical protein